MTQTFRNADMSDEGKIDLAEIGSSHELAHESKGCLSSNEESTLAMLDRFAREDRAEARSARKTA